MKKGCILINRNVCDNAPECSGIKVCVTQALFWDENKQEIGYDPDLCTGCKRCVDENEGCPVGAIRFAETENQYAEIEREIKADAQKIADLQVERYGAAPIGKSIMIDVMQDWLNEQNKDVVTFVELFNDDSIHCLLHSIKIKEIQDIVSGDSNYMKVQLEREEDITTPSIAELPVLLAYRNGSFLGKVEGYYDESQQSEFLANITGIIAD